MRACPVCSALPLDTASVCPDCGSPLTDAGHEAAERLAFEKARNAIRTLGTLYIVTASIGVIGALLLSQFLFRGPLTATEIKAMEDTARSIDPASGVDSVKFMMRIMESGVLGTMGVVQILLYGFILWTGIELRNLRYRPAAITAAALMLLLPLIGFNNCTCLSLTCFAQPVLAIYALILLTSFQADRVFAMQVSGS